MQLITVVVFAQYPGNDLYQYNYSSISPVFTGVDGQKINVAGNIFNPKLTPTQHYQITTGLISFETPIDKINSGVGVNALTTQFRSLSDNGIQYTYSYLSLQYNYQFKINDDQKLIVGVKPGFFNYGFDRFSYLPIDGGASIRSYGISYSNNLMLGGGVLYKYKKFFIGASGDNLVRRELKASSNDLLDLTDPLIHVFSGIDFTFGEKLSTTHSVYAVISPDNTWRLDVNSSALIYKWIIAGVSIQLDDGSDLNPTFNAGVNIKDVARIIVVGYSRAQDTQKNFGGQILAQFRLDPKKD